MQDFGLVTRRTHRDIVCAYDIPETEMIWARCLMSVQLHGPYTYESGLALRAAQCVGNIRLAAAEEAE